MSPARSRHAEYQAEIAHLLRLQKPDGVSVTERGVETAENGKGPDVSRVSCERRRATPREFAYAVAPQICVEIISPGNFLEEQMHKGPLYLQAGAGEFWLCDERGRQAVLQRRWAAGTLAPRPGVSGEGRDPGLMRSNPRLYHAARRSPPRKAKKSKPRAMWVWAPATVAPGETLRREVEARAQELIDTVFKPKHVHTEPEHPGWNYLTEIVGHWDRGFSYSTSGTPNSGGNYTTS